jgi:hypothetical protein
LKRLDANHQIFSTELRFRAEEFQIPQQRQALSMHAIIFDIPFMTDEHSQHNTEAKQTILDNIEKYGCHLALLEPDNLFPAES